MESGVGEVPIIVVCLIEEVETIQPLDPAHLHVNVERLRIGRGVLTCVIVQLVRADCVALRHHVPVGCVAVHAGDLVGRELEDFEDLVRLILCKRAALRPQREQRRQREQVKVSHEIDTPFPSCGCAGGLLKCTSRRPVVSRASSA